MGQQGRCVNVKTKDGKFIMSLYFNHGSGIILENRLDGGESRAKENYMNNGGNGNGQNSGAGNGEGIMTFPQKRLLFRILAQQGMEGDTANKKLMEIFQVDNLKEVGKLEASRMIDRLLKEEKKEGDTSSGIPF